MRRFGQDRFRRISTTRRRRLWVALALSIAAGCLGMLGVYLPPPWFLHLVARAYPGVMFDVPTRQQWIALTIDDAPHPDVTPQLLELLRKHHAHATFFILGEQGAAYPELLQAIRDGGHELGNHMYTDRQSIRLTSQAFEDELLRTQELLEPVVGKRWCRPGNGLLDQRTINLMRKHDFVPMLGSAYPLDLGLPTFLASQQFLRAARPGAILVLHDGAKRTRTLRILERA
jgi:peptidoglycan/xylan/chitin deacetylase (PgdA/CDA1 family)